MTNTIIGLLCGAVGGNLGGLLLKKFSLGTLWNSVVGIVGGGIGSQLLGGAGLLGGNAIVNQIGSGGIGGIVLMLVVALVKKLVGK